MPDIERLRQLRRVIEAAPEDRFQMRAWCEVAECGTAYCAGGWAAVDPWFRENTEINETLRVRPGGFVVALDPTRTVHELARLFDLDFADARDLFGINAPPEDPHAIGKDEVLENIDLLIAGEPAMMYAAIRGDEDEDEDR